MTYCQEELSELGVLSERVQRGVYSRKDYKLNIDYRSKLEKRGRSTILVAISP